MIPAAFNEIQTNGGLVWTQAITKNKEGKIIIKNTKILLLMKMSL